MAQSSDTGVTNRGNLVDWKLLTELFEQLTLLPESSHQDFLIEECPSPEMAKKLTQMMSTLDQTRPFFETPLTSRISSQPNWYASEWVAEKLNGFELTELLHEGPVAAVFKAYQETPVPRDVAIKMMRPDAPNEYLDQFRLEQKALAKLSHPNIATIHTAETSAQGVSFIVMEFISGERFIPHCDSNCLSIDKRLTLFLQVCDAISYSHQRGILHRDIKSSNILVREFEAGNTPTIIDFGISRLADQMIAGTSEKYMGTPEYMSPEHVEDIEAMDVRADVYSLGMVLFSLLVGKIPFSREDFLTLNYADRKAMILDFQPLPPSEYYAGLGAIDRSRLIEAHGVSHGRYQKQLSQELDWIYRRATNKSPENRYQSVAALANDIRRYLKREVVNAQPVSWFYRFRKFTQRHFVLTAATATGIIMAIIFVATVVNQNVQIREQFVRVEQQQKIAQSQRELAEEERDVAKQVTTLISDLFKSANPYHQDKDVEASVESILENGLRNVSNQASLPPAARYELLLTLSMAYEGIGELKKAQEINNFVLQRSDHPDALLDIRAKGNAYAISVSASDNQEALKIAQQAVDMCLENNISGEPLIRSLRLLADSYQRLGKVKQAMTLFEESLREYDKAFEQDGPLKARLLVDLATLSSSKGLTKESENSYREALKINQQFFSEEHPIYMNNQMLLATLLGTVGRHDESLPILERNYAIQLKYRDGIHPDIISAQGNLSLIYYYAGQLDKAAELMLNLLSKIKQIHGEQSLENIHFQNILGVIYRRQGRAKEALIVHRKVYDLSYEIADQLIDGPRIATAEMNLASSLTENNEWRAAMPHIDKALTHFSQSKNTNLYLGNSLMVRSVILIGLDKFSEAEKDSSESIEILSKTLSKDHRLLLWTQACNVYARIRQKKTQEDFDSLLRIFGLLKEGGKSNITEIQKIESWLALLQKA
ncbi:MAG: serine/threonine protein kinase [Paracoccaceae bacterium]|jgi:serine/threonine protein kinase